MAKRNLTDELKGLGGDLAKAVVEMKNSNEFKKLQSELSASLKSIGGSFQKAIKAAAKSNRSTQIKGRVTKIGNISKKEGARKAQEAQQAAAQKIKEARQAINKMAKKWKA